MNATPVPRLPGPDLLVQHLGKSLPGPERGPELGDEEAAKGMALIALAANFGKALPEPLCQLWLDLLRPYPSALVGEAVREVVARYEYKTLPPFAVLRRAIDELRGLGVTTAGLRAAAEWTNLVREMEIRGREAPPENLHPTTAYVLGLMGGWRNACSWPVQSLEFKRRDFLAYWADCHGNVAPEHCIPVAGAPHAPYIAPSCQRALPGSPLPLGAVLARRAAPLPHGRQAPASPKVAASPEAQ